MIRKFNTLSCLLLLAADKGGATGTATSPKPAPDAKTKNAPEPKVHAKLLNAIQKYDEHVQEAESYYVEMIELIQTEKIPRADVVQTLMKARGITFETAQSQYSRMKGIWQDPKILEQLKNGEITLKVARDSTKKSQSNPASGNATAQGAGGASKETKEARYERARKAHVAAVKECGFDLRSALVSFEADLKTAGIK
jgi:hypothetical protein